MHWLKNIFLSIIKKDDKFINANEWVVWFKYCYFLKLLQTQFLTKMDGNFLSLSKMILISVRMLLQSVLIVDQVLWSIFYVIKRKLARKNDKSVDSKPAAKNNDFD